MKKLITSFVSIAYVMSASATTVNLAGSPTAVSFFGSDGVALDSSGVDTVTIVTYDSFSFSTGVGTGRSVFGTAEVGSVFGQLGKLKGGVSDNTAAADAFNGKNVYVELLDAGSSQTAVITSNDASWVFPTNAGGVGDTQNVVTAGVTFQVYNANAVTGGYQVVPEPSTYAMFAGALALGYVMIRRRR